MSRLVAVRSCDFCCLTTFMEGNGKHKNNVVPAASLLGSRTMRAAFGGYTLKSNVLTSLLSAIMSNLAYYIFM